MKKNILLLIAFVLFSSFISMLHAQNCTVNAGVGMSLCSGDSNRIVLNGAIAGPPGTFDPASILWTIVSSPDPLTQIETPSSLLTQTRTAATIAGTYTFRLQAMCSIGGTTFQDVSYTVNPSPARPVINAFTAPVCYIDGLLTLTATPPGAGETSRWVINGVETPSSTPGSVTFTPRFDAEECQSNSAINVSYTLLRSGCFSSTSQTVFVSRDYGTVTATAFPTLACSPNTMLEGSCPGNGTVQWTLDSKTPTTAPDPVIANSTSRKTQVTGMTDGTTYIFRYTVSGSCNNGTDTVQVICRAGTPVTQAEAGPNQLFCDIPPDGVTLSGNKPAIGETVTWSQLSGGNATIISSGTPATAVLNLDSATTRYKFLYTISNGVCYSIDSVLIVTRPQLSITNLGPLSFCGSVNSTSSVLSPTFPNGPYERFGYYTRGDLDTLTASIKLLSGPGSVPNVSFFIYDLNNQGGSSGLPIITGSNPLTIGNIITTKASGSTLYPTAATNPAYFVSPRFSFNPKFTGVYIFRVSYATGCGSQTADLVVNFGEALGGANAGTNQVLPCGSTDANLVGNYVDSLGLWVTLSTPAGAPDPLLSNNTYLRTQTLNNLQPGTYVFQLASNNGPSFCSRPSPSTTRLVVSGTPPPAPNAGPDLSVCVNVGSQIQLNGSPIPNNAYAGWRLLSSEPAGRTLTFSDTSLANPYITNTLIASTTYTLLYTFYNGCGSVSDMVTITTGTASTTPTAGIRFSVFSPCLSSLSPLTPTDATSTTVPVYLSFPSSGYSDTTVTARPLINPATTVTLASGGMVSGRSVYNVNISDFTSDYEVIQVISRASSTTCPNNVATDTANIPLFKTGVSFSSNAGAPQNFCAVTAFPFTTNLNGNELFMGEWKQTYSSNGLLATIADPAANNTQVTFPASGVYRFSWSFDATRANTRNHTSCFTSSTSYTQVIVNSPPSTAVAGPSIVFCGNNGVTTLNATPVTNGGSGTWSVFEVLSGGVPVITIPSAPNSTITFSRAGQAVLQWSAISNTLTECGLSSNSLDTVSFVLPAAVSQPTQTFCGATSAILTARNPAPATGVWSLQSGPGTVNFSNSNSFITSVSGLLPGRYNFLYTVAGSTSCQSTATTQVAIGSSALANAGTVAEPCSGGSGNIHLSAANPPAGFTGTWKMESGPVTGSFSDIQSPTAVLRGITTAGSYLLSWTIANDTCSSVSYLSIEAPDNVPCVALPVSLVSFTAAVTSACAVNIIWQSAEEINFSHYIIERSYDGIVYKAIATINGAGNNASYNYVDKSELAFSLYYRLKMVDADGSFKYSSIISMRLSCYDNLDFVIAPNPAKKGTKATAIISWQSAGHGILIIRTIAGAQVQQQLIQLNRGKNAIDISTGTLPSGTYIAELRDEYGKVLATKKMVVY